VSLAVKHCTARPTEVNAPIGRISRLEACDAPLLWVHMDAAYGGWFKRYSPIFD